MINPKYDLNNYIKHTTIPVLTDNQQISELFRSDLLRIKWFSTPLGRLPADNKGSLRIHQKTPLGNLKPIDFPLIVDTAKDVYIQFLQISPKPDFEYEIEIISPIGMTRSLIEIWEYTLPNNVNNMIFQPVDNSLLIAAIERNSAIVEQSKKLEKVAITSQTWQLSPAHIGIMDESIRAMTITNISANAKCRIFIDDAITEGSPPLFISNYLAELSGANASYTLEYGFNSNIWIVTDTPMATVLVTTSRIVVPVIPPVIPPVT